MQGWAQNCASSGRDPVRSPSAPGAGCGWGRMGSDGVRKHLPAARRQASRGWLTAKSRRRTMRGGTGFIGNSYVLFDHRRLGYFCPQERRSTSPPCRYRGCALSTVRTALKSSCVRPAEAKSGHIFVRTRTVISLPND